MIPKLASHSRVAFSSIASNTGARSPGEELMTCNTSAVAVCCSKASRVSVISRAFSMAMTACAAKFCSSAISLSENGRISCRAIAKAPAGAPSLTRATQIKVRIFPRSTPALARGSPVL